MKNYVFFIHFCLKQRLCVKVRIAFMRWFKQVPQTMYRAKIRKIMYIPENPQVYGYRGSKALNYIGS